MTAYGFVLLFSSLHVLPPNEGYIAGLTECRFVDDFALL